MASKIDQPDRSIGFQFPVGHLGHLSQSQQDSFNQFKTYLEEKGVYTPKTETAQASHGDHTLLRFLRARKFEINGAYDQFIAAEKWLKDNRLDDLYESIDVIEYDETRKLYPQWVGSRDKRGMPVYLFEVGPLDTKKVLAKEKATEVKGASMEGRTEPAKMLLVMALYENLTRFVTPWCSALTNRPYRPAPITQGCNIIDIKGTGLKQFWDLKNHLQDSSALATAYHPETLDKIFIIGAPSFFPTVWTWVKRWFDPVVVSKMFILSDKEILSTLKEHIDESQIPSKYGGGHKYVFGDLPNIHPDVLDSFVWEKPGTKALPKGPIRWERGESGEMVAVAVGSLDGVKRKEVVGRIKGSKWVDNFFPDIQQTDSRDGSTHASGSAGPATADDNVDSGSLGGRPSVDSITPAMPTSAGPPLSTQDLDTGKSRA